MKLLQNRIVVEATALGVILLFALFGCAAGAGDAPTENQANQRETIQMPWVWYYDLNTGEVFRERYKGNPIERPSGGKAVAAFKFSCGDGANESSQFVGYLLRPAIAEDGRCAPRSMQVAAMPADKGDKPVWITIRDTDRPEDVDAIKQALAKHCNGDASKAVQRPAPQY
jgi:hypothetical protein